MRGGRGGGQAAGSLMEWTVVSGVYTEDGLLKSRESLEWLNESAFPREGGFNDSILCIVYLTGYVCYNYRMFK